MRRVRAALVVTLLAVVATACSRGDSSGLPTPKPGFCEAAARYDERVERNASLDEQITIIEKLERNAPKDVAADAALFLAALQRLSRGDESVVDDPDVEEAVVNVNRRAANSCGFYDSEPGDGS